MGLLGDVIFRTAGPYPPAIGLTLRLGGIGGKIDPYATFLEWRNVATVGSATIDQQIAGPVRLERATVGDGQDGDVERAERPTLV